MRKKRRFYYFEEIIDFVKEGRMRVAGASRCSRWRKMETRGAVPHSSLVFRKLQQKMKHFIYCKKNPFIWNCIFFFLRLFSRTYPKMKNFGELKKTAICIESSIYEKSIFSLEPVYVLYLGLRAQPALARDRVRPRARRHLHGHPQNAATGWEVSNSGILKAQ